MTYLVTVPELGVNDTSATVRDLLAPPDSFIAHSAALCVLETTKVSIEVEAPSEGYVAWSVALGDVVEVHQTLAAIAATPEEARAAAAKQTVAATRVARVVTAPARALMERHGITEDDLPPNVGRVVREIDIHCVLKTLVMPVETPDEKPPEVTQIAVFNADFGGRTVVASARAAGYDVVCYIDDVKAGGECDGLPVLSTEAFLADRHDAQAVFVHLRKDNKRPFVARFREAGLRAPAIVHPTAFVDASAAVSEGVLVKAGAVVDAFAVLQSHALIDNGVMIPHNVHVGSYTHVAPGVTMGGGVRFGTGCVIGVGATIAPNIEVGDNAIVLPGAVVRKHVPAGVMVDGTDRVVGTARGSDEA